MTQFKIILSFICITLPFFAFTQFTEQWHQTFNGDGDYSDRYTCITTDVSGNVYLAGSSSNPNRNIDFLVSRYNADGTFAWRHIYSGTGNGPDEANAVAFANGNVYITGYLNNAGLGNDFFTLALSAEGDSIWGMTYNDPVFNQYEQANDIIVDGNSNVIVCGESDRDPSNITNDDFLTIKYSASGVQQWTARFNDIGDATDRALALTVNTNGEVYVTGRSDNGNDDDYATIKYNGSTGAQIWSQFLDNGGIDRAADLDVDDAGNVYVTGRSSNGVDDDFRTVKYNSSGLEVYNIAYDNVEDDRADLIDVNGDGSCIIAGRSDGNATTFLNYNYRLVKYNSSGDQQWTSFYDNAAGNDDIPLGLKLSADGTSVVTGYADANSSSTAIQNDIVTIKYDALGAALWIKTFAGPSGYEDKGNACAIDVYDNVFVASQSEDQQGQRNALLLKYSGSGAEVLTASFNGIGDNGDNVRDIFIDNNDNMYIAGYSVGKDADRNMFVCKINSSGDTLWTREINGTMFGSDEEANAISVDNSGNVIISGYTKNAGSSSDITITKFNSAGLIIWTALYNGPANESDRAFDMATDAVGNVYITGKTDINSSPIITNDQVYTAKYISANGALSWSTIYDGGPGIDRGRFIRVAPSGNVYVVGKRFNGTDDDILVIKYNSTGQQQWAQTYNGISGNDDPRDMELDVSENVYFTGTCEATPNSGITDFYTMACHSNDGTAIFQKIFNGNGNGIDVSEGIEVDASGNSYITGTVDSDASLNINNDCVTFKYNNGGDQVWTHSYNGSTNLDDVGDDLALDATGNVLVTCHSNIGTVENINYQLVSIALNTNNGAQEAITNFSLSDSINVANVIKVKNSAIYLGGSTWVEENQRDILVLKYALVVGIEEHKSTDNFSVYPNPFREYFALNLPSLVGSAHVRITDLSGSLVHQEKINNTLSFIDIKNLEPGIYACTVSDNTHSISKVLIKQ